jgi:hypothetical protein
LMLKLILFDRRLGKSLFTSCMIEADMKSGPTMRVYIFSIPACSHTKKVNEN